MPLAFAIKGFAIGFAIAAPVGPIGVLCIRRSLAEEKWVGLVTGLGAATADAAYGAIAAFGLTALSGFLVAQRAWLSLVGGVFLFYLGIRTFMSKPADESARARGGGMFVAYFSTLFLTLTNPMTILSFVAVFASLGLAASPDYSSAGLTVIGVFLGSAFWWLLLSHGVALLRSRMTPRWMQAVNRISGCIILGFALFSLFHFLSRYSNISGSP